MYNVIIFCIDSDLKVYNIHGLDCTGYLVIIVSVAILDDNILQVREDR